MSIKAKWKGIGMIAVCFFTLIMTGCDLIPNEEAVLKPPLTKPEKENYDLYEVKKGTIVKKLTGTGVFNSVHVKNQNFKVVGRIVSFHVSVGDKVKKGDVLVQLDVDGLEITLKERKRDLLQAQNSSAKAKQANDEELTKIRGMELEIAQMQLDEVFKKLDGKAFVAEMDGTVTYVEDMKVGDYVQLNRTYVTIADPNQLRLTYEVENAAEVKDVQVGMKAEVTFSKETLSAEVVQTPSSAPSTENKELNEKYAKSLYLQLLTKPTKAPEMNASADISIITAKRDNIIVVPRRAVNSFIGSNTVKILDGESIQEVDVEKGIETSSEVEISSGLREGQKLILP